MVLLPIWTTFLLRTIKCMDYTEVQMWTIQGKSQKHVHWSAKMDP